MPDPGRIPLPVLSKSAFKQAEECRRKLLYRMRRYPSRAADNPYLEFLADGGFMVEALARALFPAGKEVVAVDGRSIAEATTAAMKSEDVDLFEPVFEHGSRQGRLSARVDILSKRGRDVRLIEIKAASFDRVEDGDAPFRGKRGGIASRWRPYLLDLAFQTLVLRGSLGSGHTVRPELCIVDKSRVASKELTFSSIELRSEAEAGFGKPRASFLGDPEAVRRDGFMAFVPADSEVEELLPEVSAVAEELLAHLHEGLERIDPVIGRHCRDCEFRGASDAAPASGVRDGFGECWGELARGSPHILDLYRIDLFDGRDGEGIARLVEAGVSSIRDIPDELLDGGTSTAARQRVQVECTRSGEEWMAPELARELAEAPYPLHFVDFETSRIAVPYHAGMQPYEQIAFQFSCHTIDGPGGELKHREWINVVDRYPNFEFARALREAIGDDGSMLVWSDHEKSALADIRRQIQRYGADDRDGLSSWLEGLSAERRDGGRIVDLHDLCRESYFHPRMRGRTSIKYVLPAVWESDRAVREHPWFRDYLRAVDGKILSPYDALPSGQVGGQEVGAVKDGTGAMRMYQELLYGVRSQDQAYREQCRGLLLQYCKLDTAAMVIVWMHWMRDAREPKRRA